MIARLRDPACRAIRDARGVYFWERGDRPTPPRMAFLFPGEGSQYPGMLGDLAPHFPEVRAMLDTADRIARRSGSRAGDADAPWPSEIVFGQGAETAGLCGRPRSRSTSSCRRSGRCTQLLRRLGLDPDAVVGHSSGEFLALAAADVLAMDRAFEDGLGSLAALFGRLEQVGDLPTARLVAVAADRAKVEAAIAAAGLAATVEVAMDNCPHQVVVAGEPASVDGSSTASATRGWRARSCPFARAYHTPSFAPAVGPIRDFFASIPLRTPAVPVYSCAEGRQMPADPAAIRELAVAQWTRSVAFRPAVEAMHADGVRVFVDVGARGNLAGFVEDTLRGRPAFAVAANLPRRSGLTQLNHLVASLFAQGVAIDPRPPLRPPPAGPAGPDRPPGRSGPIPDLAVGFPTMRLSDDLIARLAAAARAERSRRGRARHQAPDQPEPEPAIAEPAVADVGTPPTPRGRSFGERNGSSPAADHRRRSCSTSSGR